MRLVGSLITLLALSGCQSLPPPPVGDLCILNVEEGTAICVPIKAAVRRGTVSLIDGTSMIPISEMHNYVAESPETWAEIERYILQLKALAQKRCQ